MSTRNHQHLECPSSPHSICATISAVKFATLPAICFMHVVCIASLVFQRSGVATHDGSGAIMHSDAL